MVRFKNRYLLVEVYPVDSKHHNLQDYAPSACPSLTTHHVANQLRSTLATNFGQLASSLTSQSLSVKYCNAATGTLIIRTARATLETVWASISLMSGVPEGEGKWIWRVVHVAGTIKGAQRAAIKHTVGRLEAYSTKSGDGEKSKFAEMITKCRQAIKSIEA